MEVNYIATCCEGTDYEDTCVTAVNHREFDGLGLIPVPWEARGHATSILAGNMAMSRVAGKSYPRESWQEITRECEEIEELGDPELLESDVMKVLKYCEAAALVGQMVRMPASNELPEGAPPLPQIPSTGEEAFERALREAVGLVESYWGVIAAVAESLMEKGYLSGTK